MVESATAVGAAVVLALLLVSSTGRAAGVYGVVTSTSASAQVTGADPDSCADGGALGTATSSCSATMSGADGSSSGEGHADAAIGALGAFALANAAHSDEESGITSAGGSGSGFAEFWDQITVHAPSASPQWLEFSLSLERDDTLGVDDYATSSISLAATFYGTQGFGATGDARYTQAKTLDLAGLHEETHDVYANWPRARVPISLYYDAAAAEWKRSVYFQLRLDVGASCQASTGYLSGFESCTATTRNPDAFSVSAVRALDANGDPVAGVTLSSDSGHDYPAPEPGPVALGIAAVGAIAARGAPRRSPLGPRYP